MNLLLHNKKPYAILLEFVPLEIEMVSCYVTRKHKIYCVKGILLEIYRFI